MKNLAKEFKEFIATGSMIELAVAVILGIAVKGVIDSFTNGVMMQIVAAIFGKPNFDQLSFDLNDTPIYYGQVITTIISLIMVGLVLFFIIRAYNKMKKDEVAAPSGPSEVDLLIEIRDSLKARG